MPFPEGPFQIASATAFDIKYPTSPPSNTLACILANYSQYLLLVQIGGEQHWLLPWTAQLYATHASGSPVVHVTPQLAGATPPTGAASYVTALFLTNTDPSPGSGYPLTLQPAAAITTPTVTLTVDAAEVGAAQSRPANSIFGDLATPGPAVTLTTGVRVYVQISAEVFNVPIAAGTNSVYMAVAVTGATVLNPTIAGDNLLVEPMSYDTTRSYGFLLDGLTPGINTFTCKYLCAAGSTNAPTWGLREIAVWTL